MCLLQAIIRFLFVFLISFKVNTSIDQFSAHNIIFSKFLLDQNMDQGGGVLELHAQELKMPHAMIMQDFGGW